MLLSNILLISSFASLLILTWYYFRYKKATSTEKWGKTKGKITASYIETSFYAHQDYGHDVYKYDPKIHYKYSVKNIKYTSTNISFSDEYVHHENRAKKFIHKYSPGKELYVYYNPNEPSESVLLTGARTYNYLNVLGWFMLTVILFASSFSESIKDQLITPNSFLSKSLYNKMQNLQLIQPPNKAIKSFASLIGTPKSGAPYLIR